MTEHPRTLLDELDGTPVPGAPLDRLLREGKAAKRRHRRAVLGGTVAVVALLGGGGTLASQALAGPDRAGNEESLLAEDPNGPGASSSTRRVGVGRVSVAIPWDWQGVPASCNDPGGGTYSFSDAVQCTSGLATTGSTITFTSTGSFEEAEADGMRQVGILDGHEVVAGGVVCFTSSDLPCTQAWAVPDLDAYFVVTRRSGSDASLLEDIRSSLSVLDEGETVVPFTPGAEQEEVVADLEEAGLEVEVVRWACPFAARCSPGVSIDPPVGSVVPTGSTVTVTVTGEAPSRPDASADEPVDLRGEWVVRSLAPADFDVRIRGRGPTITFGDNGEVTGYTGCNYLPGTYEQTGDDGRGLTLSLTTTRAACDGEPPLLEHLTAVRSVTGSGDVLHLHDAKGVQVAEIVRETARSPSPADGTNEPVEPVDLPTNGWRTGDESLMALVSGTLAVDANSCVYLAHGDQRTYATWPAGYTATVDPEGRLTLFNHVGEAVARDGDRIEGAGGYRPRPREPHPCLPSGHGEVASLMMHIE